MCAIFVLFVTLFIFMKLGHILVFNVIRLIVFIHIVHTYVLLLFTC